MPAGPIMNDLRALPDEDYRFSLGITPGDAREFFARSTEHERLVAERQRWLRDAPHRYAALLPEGRASLREMFDLVVSWQPSLDLHRDELHRDDRQTEFDSLLALGSHLEPDFVLLHRNKSGRWIVTGGCVCFPSSWRLTDKLSQPLEDVHEPVPELNAALAGPIHQLLLKMKPGRCWLRSNWGVCRQPELNQHPDRHLPRLTPGLTLDDVWLRREHQALMMLPESEGVLFGIRVEHTAWRDIRQSPEAAARLMRGLQSMPEAMLAYKNLLAVRDELLRLLSASEV